MSFFSVLQERASAYRQALMLGICLFFSCAMIVGWTAKGSQQPSTFDESPGILQLSQHPSLFSELPTVEILPVKNGTAWLPPDRIRSGGWLVIGVPRPVHGPVKIRVCNRQLTDSTPLSPQPWEGLALGKKSQVNTIPVSFRSSGKISLGLGRPPEVKKLKFPKVSGSITSSEVMPLNAILVSFGDRVQVYAESSEISNTRIRALGDEITRLVDLEVLQAIESRIAPILDLDGDGRLTVLLSSRMSDLVPSEQFAAIPLRGLTWSADYSLTGSQGNRADIVYLHSRIKADAGLKSLLLHELAHAACFSRMLTSGDQDHLPEWLNEGIAHLAETFQNQDRSNWESRFLTFLRSTESAPLVVDSYSHSGRWRDPACRGAVISFFHWLSRQLPEDFVRNWLLTSSPDLAGLEQYLGCEFDDVFRAWTIEAAQTSLHETSRCSVDRNLENSWIVLQGSTFMALKIDPQSGRQDACCVEFPPNANGQVTFIASKPRATKTHSFTLSTAR